jgi:glutaredoxin
MAVWEGISMITLYRRRGCPQCSGIEEALKELTLAHRVIEVGKGEVGREMPEQPCGPSRPPVLIDEGKVFRGSKAILDHLEDLKGFRALWYKFQSDACYCDEEGNVE